MPENLPEEIDFKQKPAIRLKIPRGIGIGFLIVLILLPLLVFFLLRRPAVNNLPQGSKNPPATFSPYELARTHDDLQNCNVKEQGNPIVEHVKTINDFIVGSFRGNINEYSYDASSNTATIVLISPKGDQTQLFSLKSERGLVYDAVLRKEISLSDLKRGETVSISFNCFPKHNNDFKITRVNLTGKI